MSDEPQKPWPPLARKAFRDAARTCRQKATALVTEEWLSAAERAEGIAALETLAVEFEEKASE
jgi:hypothetical protein